MTTSDERLEFDPEKMTEPFVDDDYDSRTGYDENFLVIPVPMPTAADVSVLAEMNEGGHVIPYAHFSVIMHENRRLAVMTSSNVDGSEEAKRPEPDRDYGRKALAGLGKNDLERWVLDPRLDAARQLPDKFYTKDRGNFDKGHIVRRDDVTWGKDFDEVRRANGDTYHVTNCSPQVDAFNRSNLRGDWGRLENYILKQGRTEKLCLFAGPVLDDDNDKVFKGKDDQGDVEIQIPSLFWKVIVARNGERLETFGFLLEQDLSESEVEFNVSAEWQGKMIAIVELEDLLPDLEFPDVLRESDQAGRSGGEAIRESGSLERYSR
jgi:endonuclease G